MPTPESQVPIALLSQSGESSRHLREALSGGGASIVYEAPAAQLDRDALEQSGARVVVVNLDAEVDAHLDEVYALLGDDRYNVIFNEAQVSAQLSGWEQARWARHLAAKILGGANADPPRPAGAEPVPVRAPAIVAPIPVESPPPPVPQAATVEAVIAQPVQDAATPESLHAGLDLAEFAAPPAPPAEHAGYDFAATDSLLMQADARHATDLAAAFDTGGSDIAATDLLEFSLEPTAPAPTTAGIADVEGAAHDAQTDHALDFMPADVEDAGDALGFGDLDDFAGESGTGAELDTPSLADAIERDVAPVATTPSGGFDFETPFEIEIGTESDLDPAGQFTASADAIESASDATTLSDLELLDLDWADAPKAPVAEQSEAVDVPPPPPVSHAAFAWSLADVDETDEPHSASVAQVPAKANEFGIETIPASEFLAPPVEVSDAAPAPSSLSALSLELVPLEEAVAPQAQRPEPASRETWLDTSAFGTSGVVVRKVWVLGASIGGPEAVREFLASIPKDFPALFLLAQHMGPDFMALMAQQLVKATALTVRTPTHGERVAHGDIVVVPITHRLRVDAQGVIMLEPLGDPVAAHSPSIDQVLRDVADRFGAKAGAIIFSGMAEDAAEGSRYLVEKGGKVYVQDPQTCVISSMVDGVLETGVVGFTGSPRELADRVLGERSKSAANS